MRDALAAALGERATLVFAGDRDAIAAVREASAEMTVLIVEPHVPNLDRTMLLAGIGPLAIERAPTRRIAALDLAEGARAEDVIAAAAFLIEAHSTTGQVLRVAP